MTTQHLHTYCAMCASRCGVLATVEDGRLTKVTADPEHPNGCICVKGAAAPEIVYAPDRLQYPMVRSPRHDFVYASADVSRLCRIGVTLRICSAWLSRLQSLYSCAVRP